MVLGEPIWDRNTAAKTVTCHCFRVLGEPIWDKNLASGIVTIPASSF